MSSHTRFFPRCGIMALLGAAGLCVTPHAAHAASLCGLGFIRSDTLPVIDGQQTHASEWIDATVLSASSSGCLNMLIGLDLLDHNVTVYTKRYLRSGQYYLGFRFDVIDGTQTTASGGPLVGGERIVIQFDPNASGGAMLEASDRRLMITHRWISSGGVGSEITDVVVSSSTGTLGAGVCGGGPRWDPTAAVPTHNVAIRKSAGGYIVEFEVRASDLGPAGINFGVAFQVIDDWGDTAGGANSSAASFPAALPYSTQDNAANGCNDSWRVPQNWGTGYYTTAPVDVWISRLPVFWSSVDITAFACTSPSYTYHPTQPCRLTLTARVHKNVTGTQTRNVLFLWADHGSSPSTWRVIDFRENVAITGDELTVTSAQWSGVPTGLLNHPCVRAYILPAAFESSFDRAAILGIDNAAELAAMEAAYDIEPHHWAQKNISAPSGQPNCTVTGCTIGLEGTRSGGLFALVAASIGPRELAAQQLPTAALQVVTPGSRPPITNLPTQQQARVHLSAVERRMYPEHAYVQVRAIGWEPGPVDSLPYILAEPLGGLIQAIPLTMLANNAPFPMQFNVGNSGTRARTVFLVVDTEVPAGHEPLTLDIDTRPRLMQPNEEQRRAATVQLRRGGNTGGRIPGCGGGGGNAAVGIGLLFFWVVYGRSRKRV